MIEKKMIGIVDDHVQSAISISTKLEYEGFKTFQTYSGDDAVKKCKSIKPDVLLVDINVDKGGLNGYEVAEALPGQKILFMTHSNSDPNSIKKLKNVIGVIRKPIDINEFLRFVKN